MYTEGKVGCHYKGGKLISWLGNSGSSASGSRFLWADVSHVPRPVLVTVITTRFFFKFLHLGEEGGVLCVGFPLARQKYNHRTTNCC